MTADRAVSLIGLGFGDCGKGQATDHLVRRLGAHTVVRFNGGAQAGHNVVLTDGRRHTFSQFGAGSFSPGVFTALAHAVVVHPTALVEEARVLARSGIEDAFARLCIDGRCRVTTPFHQAAGRLRERARGSEAHGSCGAGFGETVSHAIAHPADVVHWADLLPGSPCATQVEDRLDAIRQTLRRELLQIEGGRPPAVDGRIDPEWRMLEDADVASRWLRQARDAARRVGGGMDTVAHLRRRGTIVFEGAQGMLLDERHGFHPHTTWSDIGPGAVDAVLDEAGRPPEVVHLGVMRTYLTRHGAGPMPTADASLDALLNEPDNHDAGWQGRFRRGHTDAVLLRYALEAAGHIDGLFVTHLDAFERTDRLRWCDAYRAMPASTATAAPVVTDPVDAGRIVAIDAARVAASLDSSQRLGELLRRVEPEYEMHPPATRSAFLERIESVTGLPIHFGSRGPTHHDVDALTMRFEASRTPP